MAASPVKPGPPEQEEEEEEEGRKPWRHPHGAVVIVVPDGDLDVLLSSSSASADNAVDEERDEEERDEEEEEEREERTRARGRTLFSPWRAAGAVLALAMAGFAYACLYAAGDAGSAWRFLATRDEDQGGRGGRRTSFLLPLYRKPRRGGAREAARGGAEENSMDAVFPLAGDLFPDGLYYTTISIGNPPRPYFLDVDTGSELTWIQCDAPSTSCGKGAHPLYRPKRANIVPASDPLCEKAQSSPNQCVYEIAYADGSSSMGVYVRDNMQLITEDGEQENSDVVFGCGYDQRGNLLDSLQNTDGMLGLSTRALSLPTQLADTGIISNVFGHCMTKDPSARGYLFLGDDYIPRWGMTWVPIRHGPADIVGRAQVQRVNHGDRQLNVERELTQVIFDSGTTYTYFPREAYTNLITDLLKDASQRFVQDYSDKTLPFCMKADFAVRSVDDVKHFFKPLSLQFEKRLLFFRRIFYVPPEDYLIISDKGNVCLGVLDGTELGFDSEIIVGDVFLRGKLVVYDNDEKQMGWTESDCTNPRKQSRLPAFLRRALRNQLM